MIADRPAQRWLRIALAVAFGFMNLGHGPIMTFAHAGAHAGMHDNATTTSASHHDHAHHQQHATVDGSDAGAADDTHPPGCNAFGCFITVGPALIGHREPAMLPIGKLQPPQRPAIAPDAPEPADPPPRFHA